MTSSNKNPFLCLVDAFLSRDVKVQYKEAFNKSTFLAIILELQIRPGAKIQGIKILETGEIKVSLRARAVEGEANLALMKFLSKELGVSLSQIGIISGVKSRSKRVQINYELKAQKNVLFYLQKLNSFLH